jgi:hypothetical protein
MADDHWAAPLCDACWDRLHPDKPSPRLDCGASETCDDCGKATRSGIYLRRDRNAPRSRHNAEPESS